MNKNNRMEDNSYQSKVRKIFVGGLSADLTEVEFKSYFEKFGRITDIVIMHDSLTNRPRGFGFITFDSVDSVDSVLQNNFHELNGRLVEVKRAVPKKSNFTIGHTSQMRTLGGKGPFLNSNVPPHYPYYGSSYAIYPGYTRFSHYGGLGVDLYVPSLYESWYPHGLHGLGHDVAPMASGGAWYDLNFVGVGMYSSHYQNFPTHPTFSKGARDMVARNEISNTSGNVKINRAIHRNRNSNTRGNVKINQAIHRNENFNTTGNVKMNQAIHRGNVKMNQTIYRNGNMSADAMPFQIKDRA